MARSPVHLLALALTFAFGAPAAAAVSWPAGTILDVGYNGSQGTSKLEFMADGDSAFFGMGYGTGLSSGWQLRRLRDDASAGGSIYEAAYVGLAPGGAGNLLHLRCVSTSSLELGGYMRSGAALPTTTLTGPVNSFGLQAAISACSADNGGGWFLFRGYKAPVGVRLLRATATGAVAPGWPTLGWRVATAGTTPYYPTGIAADGAGGALVLLGTDRMRVVRVAGDTTFTPGWPAGGLALEQTPTDYSIVFHAKLVRSDATHFLAVWTIVGGPAGGFIRCQRFSLDGTLDPAWPADGVLIRDPAVSGVGWDSALEFQTVPDGAGGLSVAWDDSNRVWVRHVQANGTFPSAYAARELALVDLTGSPATKQKFGLARGAGDGVSIVFAHADGSLRGRWFDGGGAPWPAPALHDRPFFTYAQLVAAGAGYYLRGERSVGATADGEGGVYFAWNGEPSDWFNTAYVSHDPGPNALLAVPPPAPSSTRALAAGPNPARGSITARFTLPDARPARLELLDLAGRRVRSLEAGGAGAHAERFDDLGNLAPGVYLLRLSHAGAVRTARVAVIR